MALAIPVSTAAQSAPAGVVISQIYGGGGNQGAVYRNDFVELFNRGHAAVDISGWSLQYASASGATWTRTPLAGVIQPGQYYLIALAQGAGGTVSLPTADATGSTNLGAASGKLALVASSELLSGPAPTGAQIVDFVGYGEANAAWGRPAPELSNSTAAWRRSGGCQDTRDNAADFEVLPPQPRSAAATRNVCSAQPEISPEGVASAASYLAGAVAPGEIVVIFGSNLGPPGLERLRLTPDGRFLATELGGTRVFFDGIAAPLLYVSDSQLSAIVPQAVAGRAATELWVDAAGRSSRRISLPVVAARPALFTRDASGRGQGAVLNEDYSRNGPDAPAAKGSFVMLYGTGAGLMSPQAADGEVIHAVGPVVRAAVRVWFDGEESDTVWAGAAPGMVNGVLQVNARIPGSLKGGGAVAVRVRIGEQDSQSGVTVFVDPGSATPDGTGPAIEARLASLRASSELESLAEIPHDYIGLPSGWLGLISWNIQTGGTSTAPDAPRPPMVQAALRMMFGGTYQILAAQEIPNEDSARLLRHLLPGGSTEWQAAFFDTTSMMDNGIWYRSDIVRNDSFPLFVTGWTAGGRFEVDSSKTTHPPVVAHFQAGDFDFSLVSLHLTFAEGDTAQSVRELGHLLDYLDWYFDQPDTDPDVIVCGDFNIPSALSGQTGRGGVMLDAVFDSDARFREGKRRFVVTVHEPTSRSLASAGGRPAGNYDHCVLSADTLEEFIQARRVDTEILTSHPEDPEVRLTSDHFPVVAFFRTSGDGVVPDRKTRIRPDNPVQFVVGGSPSWSAFDEERTSSAIPTNSP